MVIFPNASKKKSQSNDHNKIWLICYEDRVLNVDNHVLSTFPSLLKSNHSPTYLNPLLDSCHLQHQIIFFDQGAKFTLVIKNKVLVIYLINSSMISRYTYVCYPDLTFMTSTDFYAVVWNVLDHHHVVCLLGYALEHYVLACWLLDRHQLMFSVVFFDETRVLVLADFTVEFLEVVLDGASDDLLLHFGLVPFLETMEMNQSTSATTLTWLT